MHEKESLIQPPMTRRSLLGMMSGVVSGVPLLIATAQSQSAPSGMAASTQVTQPRELPSKFSIQPIRIELSPKWVRAVFGGQVIADSREVLLVWDRSRTPVYYFPEKDVRMNFMTPSDLHTKSDTKGEASYYNLKVGEKESENAVWYHAKPSTSDPSLGAPPDLKGYVAFVWGEMDAWYEEGEEVFVHPHDPYHRIDVLSSARNVRVVLGGMTVAESNRPVLLFETGFPTRYYLPKADVRFDLLRPSDTISRCAYKGEARYYSVEVEGKLVKDIVWYYRFPTTEVSKIVNNLAFYSENVDAVFVDGKELAKPQRRG